MKNNQNNEENEINKQLNESRARSIVKESSESYERELRRRFLECSRSNEDSEDIEWGDLFLK